MINIKKRLAILEEQSKTMLSLDQNLIIIVPSNTTKTVEMARLGVTSEAGRIFIILPEESEYEA